MALQTAIYSELSWRARVIVVKEMHTPHCLVYLLCVQRVLQKTTEFVAPVNGDWMLVWRCRVAPTNVGWSLTYTGDEK